MKPSEILAEKMMLQAQPLFTEGSVHFQNGDFVRAIALDLNYSQVAANNQSTLARQSTTST